MESMKFTKEALMVEMSSMALPSTQKNFIRKVTERKKRKQESHLNSKLSFGHENSKAMSSESLGGIEKYKLQNRKSILGWLSKSHELVKIQIHLNF